MELGTEDFQDRQDPYGFFLLRISVGRAAGHESGTVGEALPDRGLDRLQVGAMDQTAPLLLGAPRGGAHEAPHSQVARTLGAHHFGLPGHPRAA